LDRLVVYGLPTIQTRNENILEKGSAPQETSGKHVVVDWSKKEA
jgi:hypothetical protein